MSFPIAIPCFMLIVGKLRVLVARTVAGTKLAANVNILER